MAEKKKELREQPKSLREELMKQMVTLSTSGFGLVAALAWNSLIQELVNNYIKRFLPKGSGLLSLFIYALVITSLAVFVTYQLTQVLERIRRE